MLVKCEKCGYENFPQHCFCGMCGTALPAPKPPSVRPNPEPPSQAPKPVSRPSPATVEPEQVDPRSVSYLLEDEPPPSHRGRNVLLFILLAGAVAAASWYWRQDLRALTAGFSSRAADGSAQPDSSAPAAPAATPESAPATSANASTEIDKPSTGASDAPAAAAQTQAPPAAAPAVTPADSTTNSAALAGAPKPDEAGEAARQPAPSATPPKVRAQHATAPAAGAGDLEAEGEKYLYGNGVPENCARARKDLLAAAQHGNAKAANVLGTMYATGHCATRDLPTAYRWFGRSLQKDPGNTRIEEDLKVLWSQMTPEEQKLALRGKR